MIQLVGVHIHVHTYDFGQCSSMYIGLVVLCMKEMPFFIYICGPIVHITKYGSTVYVRIAMVFLFPPYIWKFSSYFNFKLLF
jgi:hypothetical protein